MRNRHRIATITVDSWFQKDHVIATAINHNADVLTSHDTQIDSLLIADSNHANDIIFLLEELRALKDRVRTLEAQLAAKE